MASPAYEAAKAAAPEVPGDTCPVIDRLSTRFDACAFDVQRIRGEFLADRGLQEHEWASELEGVASALESARSELETVRAANEALRKSGRYWYGVAQRLDLEAQHTLYLAERFITGFEGDELQEGVDALLARIRAQLPAQGGEG